MEAFGEKYLSLKSCSFKPNFQYSSTVLKLIGFKFFEVEKNTFWNSLHFGLNYTQGILSLMCCIYTVVFETSYIGDRMEALVATMIGILIMIKMTNIWTNRHEIRRLRQRACEKSGLLDKIGGAKSAIGMKYRKISNKIVVTISLLYVLGPLVFHSYPIIFSGDGLRLPMHIVIPGVGYDYHPGYEINYACILIAHFNCFIGYLGSDLSFFITIMFIVSQLEVLMYDVRQFGDMTKEHKSKESQRKLIREAVKLHLQIFNDIDHCNRIYHLIILSTICLCTLTMCMCLVHISIDTLAMTWSLLPALVFQVFLFSFFGETIVSKCEELSTSIYSSLWYNLSTQDMKKVLLILQNSQRPIGLSVGGFSKLSLQTFTDVMKTCYSFATFVNNMM